MSERARSDIHEPIVALASGALDSWDVGAGGIRRAERYVDTVVHTAQTPLWTSGWGQILVSWLALAAVQDRLIDADRVFVTFVIFLLQAFIVF